jgi:hypothetical protein
MWRRYMMTVLYCCIIGCIILCIVLFKSLLAIDKRLLGLEEFVINEYSTQRHTGLEKPKNIESEIASGLIKGIKQLRTDDENHLKLLALARKAQQTAMPVISSNSVGNEFINTGGDLIPANLTKEEREILKMWHET